jgi:uncharacterized protein (DUF1800 family)
MKRIPLVALLVLAWPLTAVGRAAAPATPDDATIAHVLSRLTFGPRPGDVARVREMGLDRWIERQLHPEAIDDHEVEARLAELPTFRLSSHELMARYDVPPEAKRELKKREADMEGAGPAERREARREVLGKLRLDGTPQQVVGELQQAKVIRAALSERQLDEVLVDFWMNHFNVYAQKGKVRFLAGEYERTIRRHAWGKFEDLLVATAKSPAMLFYLDNWLSTTENPIAPRAERPYRPYPPYRPYDPRYPGSMPRLPRTPPADRPAGEAKKGPRGINENYARELMELHTLGVDGGYTQADVREVARAFTGWTIRGLRDERPEFAFDERRHDRGDKHVLGLAMLEAGEREGLEILHRLANDPHTARLVTTKLARRLVADEPPPALVEHASDVFLRTHGDIREVVRAIVSSKEFLSPESFGGKVKTPLDFVVSSVRATGASVGDGRELARRIAAMGMPLYLQQPPTGYKDSAEAWVSTNGLVARLNFALDLAASRIPGVTVSPAALAPPEAGGAIVDRLASAVVPGGLGEATRRTIEKAAGESADPARLLGLILGSPEFQRR